MYKPDFPGPTYAQVRTISFESRKEYSAKIENAYDSVKVYWVKKKRVDATKNYRSVTE